MGRRVARRSAGLTWLVSWPFSLVFAAMLFVVAEEVRRTGPDGVAPGASPESTRHLPERIDALTAALQTTSLALPDPVTEMQGSGLTRHVHRRYMVPIRPEDQEHAQLAIETLRNADPAAVIVWQPRNDGFEAQVAVEGLLTHTIQFQWKDASPPRIALLVEFLGDDLRAARDSVGVDAPVALGVRPGRPFSKEVAELAHMFDREVFLQLCASDDGAEDCVPYPVPDAGGEIDAALDGFLAGIPHVVGVTGAVTFGTAQPGDALGGFLSRIKARNLLCVGTLGQQPESFAAPAARAGVRLETRVVPVNGREEPAQFAAQLRSLTARARDAGAVVGVMRLGPGMVEELSGVVGEWRGEGINLVTVSSLAGPAEAVSGQNARVGSGAGMPGGAADASGAAPAPVEQDDVVD